MRHKFSNFHLIFKMQIDNTFLSFAGRKAWWSLLHNSRRLTPQFAKTQRYEKYGDFDIALKQFLTLNPTNVRVKESAEGVVSI